MAAAEIAAEKRVKRRAWGKTRHREKMDPMEVEETLDQDKSSLRPGPSKADLIDLQHPELLTNDRLVEVLSGMRVQIPVYSDGEPSRERLIYLFRKHVTPRPQREGLRGRGGGRRRWREQVAMEVDHGRQRWAWTGDGSGGTSQSGPLQRKRKLEDGPIPSEAKRPMDAALHSLSKISVTDSASATINPLPEGKSTPMKVIRLRRPEVKEVPSDTPGRLQSGKTSVSVTTNTKLQSSPDAVSSTRATPLSPQSLKERITWP